ncbi:hypothetical protein [Arenimonas sp.]|uniref:hypothetical protein n=1 Tax=Arenimonas sp. TaxID=1872635 RepID=UPI0039E3D657
MRYALIFVICYAIGTFIARRLIAAEKSRLEEKLTLHGVDPELIRQTLNDADRWPYTAGMGFMFGSLLAFPICLFLGMTG